MVFHDTPTLMTQLYLSFQPDDPTVAARISACLTDNSVWIKDHHLQLHLELHLVKTELLMVLAISILYHNLSIQLGSIMVSQELWSCDR